MRKLIKPPRLKPGDRVATVSLSWGGAGEEEILWRYHQGKERLERVFGLEVVEMPHTLRGADFVYHNPQKRAEDLMAAFADPSIKAIISCIGGNDSIRMLPYIDLEKIKANPKILMGYSDTTVSHMLCLKAGLSSFYGPAILTDFAENVAMSPYTIESVNKTLFCGEPVGEILPSTDYTAEWLEWIEQNKGTQRRFVPNSGYELLGGQGRIRGRLLGGCLEVLSNLRGTKLFPPIACFEGAILFLETCEELPEPWYVEDALRALGAMGVLERIAGVFWAKPQGGRYYEEYKAVIKKVAAEFGREDLPILYNGSFGHNEPKMILPYGAMAEIDCVRSSFAIIESAVE